MPLAGGAGIGVPHGVLRYIWVYLELKRGVKVIIGRSKALGATFSEQHRQVALTCLIRATLPERRGEVARAFIARRHENGPGATSRSDPSRSLPKPGATSRSDYWRSLRAYCLLEFMFTQGPFGHFIMHYNNYQQKSYSNNQQSGYQPRNNQQGSYQPQQNPPPGFNNKGHHSSQQQANPSTSTPQVSSTDALLKQILESQTRSEKHVGYELKNLHSKIDGSYNELNNKFRTLENQFAAMNTQQNRQQGSLPGKSEQNPKETMKAITLRSGKELPQRALTKDAEKQGEGVAINIDDEVVIVVGVENGYDEVNVQIPAKCKYVFSQQIILGQENVTTYVPEINLRPNSI
ncbi:hypothetical protein DY000_02039127 [Brassica cretica]|uniref:Transposase Tnp1/En/Spm-like domain-containing protein n=1 Tax=Brassica cretica TaxID=69181 RepID=A0ABQ7B960_BRACR|nr:hypothetical protein DY000_02039127 [Brassica cretica]